MKDEFNASILSMQSILSNTFDPGGMVKTADLNQQMYDNLINNENPKPEPN